MANDIFTGGPSGAPIDWSVATSWSTGEPTTSDVAEQTGAATIDFGSYTLAGLVLESGADLGIGGGELLDVTGAGNPAFGGAGTTIEVAGHLIVGNDVTSAAGTVTVEADG
jgi:hypothetical protein